MQLSMQKQMVQNKNCRADVPREYLFFEGPGDPANAGFSPVRNDSMEFFVS